MADHDEELSDELAKKYDPERLLSVVQKKAGLAGEALDLNTRAKYEQRFGVDMGHVRVVRGAFADALTAKHNAFALTVGRTGMVVMSSAAEKSSVTAQGRGLLAHELRHVAQAKSGLFASSRGADAPFGDKREAEAEAGHAEAREIAEAQGIAATDGERAAAQRETAVIARAMELIDEWLSAEDFGRATGRRT